MDALSKARQVKEKHEKSLMLKKSVVGCAVGYKIIDEKKTDQICIVCYVIKKIPSGLLAESDQIPRVIEGILTDVVESGELKAL